MKPQSTFSKPWRGQPYGKPSVLFTLPELMGLDSPAKPPVRPAGGLRDRPRVGAPIRPNLGLAASYAGRINAIVDEMHKSVIHWVRASYRANPPATMAYDDLSWRSLTNAMKGIATRWLARFDEMAEKLARHFAQSVGRRTDAALRKILTDGGMMLREWKLTDAQRDAIGAIVQENVSLIKSIPRQYLARVEQDVMRSVAAGRDLKQLEKDLQEHYGVTRDRARLIALDQNNKATAFLRRVRAIETGTFTWIWMHSSGRKQPRPTHLAAGKRGQRFDIREGWFDPHEGRKIQPGELIHCGCTCRPVLPGIPSGAVIRGFAA